MSGATSGNNGHHQHYCLRWNNYQCNMTSVFHQLLLDEAFVDVTLACNEASLKAHKVILSACSPFFQKLLLENPCKHPVIILPQEVNFQDVKSIIEFVYKGEIDVTHDQLQDLIKTADQLQIKGLCEVSEKECRRSKEATAKRIVRYRLSHFHRRRVTDPARRMLKRRQLSSPCIQIDSQPGLPPAPPTFISEAPQAEFPVWSAPHPPPLEKRACYTSEMVKAEEALAMFSHPHHQAAPPPVAEEGPSGSLIPDLPGNMPPDREQQRRRGIGVADEQQQRRGEGTGDTIFGAEEMNSIKSFEEDSSAMTVTPELPPLLSSTSLVPNNNATSNSSLSCTLAPLVESLDSSGQARWSKTWTQQDMDAALEALRTHALSLTKASATYGIPSTTLWQRAHRLGIDTPKKEGPGKTWTEEHLGAALEALRSGKISANRASKEYGIPSSTLYKIARKEGIRLAAPFNAAPTTWSAGDLNRALDAIKSGASVQRAAAEFGIPSGTLYGRCKREGIELQKSVGVPWSEDDMGRALDTVRMGDMSINQAAIHFNLPYSSLYGRVKRVKSEVVDVADVVHDGLDFVAAFQD